MSNPNDKPLTGALRAVREVDHVRGNICFSCAGEKVCAICAEEATIIARESGLAEIVDLTEYIHGEPIFVNDIPCYAVPVERVEAIQAAARRVREG